MVVDIQNFAKRCRQEIGVEVSVTITADGPATVSSRDITPSQRDTLRHIWIEECGGREITSEKK